MVLGDVCYLTRLLKIKPANSLGYADVSDVSVLPPKFAAMESEFML